MIISGRTFNENEINSFIYKRNDSLSDKLKVLIKRITHFLTTFHWINSEKIFNSIHTNETLTCKVFKNADLSVSLNKKIYDISQRILKREERINLLKSIAKPSSYYEFPVFKNNSLLEWIHLIHKTDISDDDKQKFDDLPEDFEIRISILNKIALLYHANIPTTLTPENFTDEAFLKCLNDATKDLERAYHLLTTNDLSNLIKTLPFNEIPLLISLQKNSEERIKEWIDKPFLKTKESLLLNINLLLDEKVKEKRKIVETGIDLEQFRASDRSRLGQIIALFKKDRLSPEEREAIINYQIPNFEEEVQAYAATYGCAPPPPFSEEEAKQRVARLKALFPPIDYSVLLPPDLKTDNFPKSLAYYQLSAKVQKPFFTKREQYEILQIDLTYAYRILDAMDTARSVTKLLYHRGLYNIDVSKLAQAINDSSKAVVAYTDQVEHNFFELHHFKEVIESVRRNRAMYSHYYHRDECFVLSHIYDHKISLENPIQEDTYTYYKEFFLQSWDQDKKETTSLPKVLDEMYLKRQYGITIIYGDYNFCKFLKEIVDIVELKNLKTQKHLWEKLTDTEKEIGEFLIFVFDHMSDQNDSIRDKIQDLRKYKFPYLNADIWSFAKKFCDAKRTRIPL